MVISMLKIRRPLGRLIFNMGIAIPGKTVFLIETAPRILFWSDWFCYTSPICVYLLIHFFFIKISWNQFLWIFKKFYVHRIIGHSIDIVIFNQTSVRHFSSEFFCGWRKGTCIIHMWLCRILALIRYWDIHFLWYLTWCSGFWSM